MRNVFLTTLSLSLVIIVLIVGAYAFFKTPEVKNRVSFFLGDEDLILEINSKADWTDGEIPDFNAITGPNGLSANNWSIPDIDFSTDGENELTIASITITITNLNQMDGVSIHVAGIAYDSDPLFSENPRFISRIKFVGNTFEIDEEEVTEENKEFTRTIPSAPDEETSQVFKIIISFELNRDDFDIDFENDIKITLTSESATA
ncbi:MAG: hypothetical protein PHO06_04015 [Clostridia bacterium]|jgi:hypothetical protein|nr:hypothetical protein [Clostridia bacterium]MDD4408360.1 hypothetical protein [Clostridia bacterium]